MSIDHLPQVQRIMSRISAIEQRISTPPASITGRSFDAALAQAIGQDPLMTQGMGAAGPMSLQNLMSLQGLNSMNPNNYITLTATTEPQKVISYQGYKMEAQTAARLLKLEQQLSQTFPGRKMWVTSSMEGMHSDPNHPAGKAVDFVVDGLTAEESKVVEDLCWKSGLKPFNEYVNSSTYKTGDHMHVDLVGGSGSNAVQWADNPQHSYLAAQFK